MDGRLELASGRVDLRRGVFEDRGGEVRALSTREADLLRYLAGRPGQVVTRDELLSEVWGYSDAVVSRACDNTVRRLREKMERDPARPDHLITVHGSGYRFEPLGAAAPAPVDLAPTEPPLRLGDRLVDLGRARVRAPGGEEVALTGQELALLRRLLAAGGAVVSRATLLRVVWGGAGGRAVDFAVRRLRTKIEADPSEPRFLLTAPGGYRLERPAAAVRALFGRGALLAELEELARRPGPIALVGPGGVGKSAVAEAWADRRVAATRVAVGSARDEAAFLAAVADALGVPLGADPGRLAAAVRGDALVLDGLDRVADAGRIWVERWVAAQPGLVVVATSRARLGIAGERVLEVPPLAPPAALELFTERARAVSRGFRPGEAARRLVERLDGLPLAIELAAARVEVLSPEAMVERPLGDVVGAMRRVLAESFDALDPPAHDALLRLALFRGPFTIDDAEDALGPGALDRVQELRDRSLVARAPDEGPEVRLAISDLVREHARERRQARDDRGAPWVRAHVSRLAALGADPHLRRLDRSDADRDRRRLLGSWAELAGAVEDALALDDPESAARCAVSACWVATRRGPAAATVALAKRVLAARFDARLAEEVGYLQFTQLHADDEATRWVVEAAERPGSDPADAVRRWFRRALVQRAANDAGWRESYQIAAEHADRAGEPLLAAVARSRVALDPELASRLLWDALPRAGADLYARWLALADLQWLAWRRGHIRDALARGQDLRAVLEALDRRVEAAAALVDQLSLCAILGETDEIERWAAEAEDRATRLGLANELGMSLVYRGVAARNGGDLPGALALLNRARSVLDAASMPQGRARAEQELAEVHRLLGDAAGAIERCAAAAGGSSQPWTVGAVRSIRAAALADLGRHDEALVDAAHAVEQTRGHPIHAVPAWARAGLARLRAGDRAGAEALLVEAEALAAAHGLGHPRADSGARLQELRRALR